MLVSDFDYVLPERLIAQQPATARDASRLLVVDRKNASFIDSAFCDLRSYLGAGDVLVLNNTRVFAARLIGNKVRAAAGGKSVLGGRVEIFLVRPLDALVWEVLARPGRGLTEGAGVQFGAGELAGQIIGRGEGGRFLIRFDASGDLDSLIDRIGSTPLPPYIKRDKINRLDEERYQTVYASKRGAIAAPTAGLHFTAALLDSIAAGGVEIVEITLHVGYGTFQPVRAERVEDHKVEPESYAIGQSAAERLNRALSEGRRIVAVGTTTTRALESASRSDRTGEEVRVRPGRATTDLFIYPGFEFRVVRALITNFHLPRSSLLMLVSGFTGRELVLEAYRHAIERDYRFYSYGDAMLIM